MVRKFAAAVVALAIAVGAVFAEEVKGTFVKFADGKLTVKVDDKEKEYKVPSDLKVKFKGKDGEEKEFPVSGMLGRMKEGTKLTLEVDKDEVKSVKAERKGKGK
jgi:Rieske Fe-S protein